MYLPVPPVTRRILVGGWRPMYCAVIVPREDERDRAFGLERAELRDPQACVSRPTFSADWAKILIG